MRRAAALPRWARRGPRLASVRTRRLPARAASGSCGRAVDSQSTDRASMTDTHIRILRLLADHRRRELSAHDGGATGQTASEPRRRHLQRSVARTGTQLTQAEARRRPRPGRRPASRHRSRAKSRSRAANQTESDENDRWIVSSGRHFRMAEPIRRRGSSSSPWLRVPGQPESARRTANAKRAARWTRPAFPIWSHASESICRRSARLTDPTATPLLRAGSEKRPPTGGMTSRSAPHHGVLARRARGVELRGASPQLFGGPCCSGSSDSAGVRET